MAKQKQVDVSELTMGSDGLMYLSNETVPFTGKSEERHSNNQLKRLITFKQGKRRGPFVLYHDNGQKKLEGYYKYRKPVLDGSIETYHRNGNSYQYASIYRGVIDGSYYEHDSEGLLLKDRYYYMGTFMDLASEGEPINGYVRDMKHHEDRAESDDWSGYYDDDKEVLVALPDRVSGEREHIAKENELIALANRPIWGRHYFFDWEMKR